ncbi:MAG: hypothetical protein GY725_11495 [bacterium]|nr:hypothetical protein [bacterium]
MDIRRELDEASERTGHSLHVPIMGTGFTIDSPLRVARYGISSVISLVDDGLIEKMRRYHSEQSGEFYQEIGHKDQDRRARRITAYLDLLDLLIQRQVEALQASAFEPGSEITRYYELLPEGPLKKAYRGTLELADGPEKHELQDELRRRVVPGTIDVNIMTKVDRSVAPDGTEYGPDSSDALAAARGYANSGVSSSLVLSAGMNPRLFSYLASHEGFAPNEEGELEKQIVIKVSDYRSALVQGKVLAKKGIWVSEFRIESGLNCGGHAFPTKGVLLGPILEEFKAQRGALQETLHKLYCAALEAAGREIPAAPREVRVTVQGGIGTAAEHALMLDHFGANSVGWGSPFLLVPEVTNLDDEHLELLCNASDSDVFLSEASPLSIRFWNLRTSASERARRERIAAGRPGSACPNGYVATTTEFRDVPECLSSRAFQKPKLLALEKQDLSDAAREREIEKLLAKSCICCDLAGAATSKLGIDSDAKTAICPGPSIRDYSRVATLEEMLRHIYGEASLSTSPDRQHVFNCELGLYRDYLREECERAGQGVSELKPKYLQEFHANLLEGIRYYRDFSDTLPSNERTAFRTDLDELTADVEAIALPA